MIFVYFLCYTTLYSYLELFSCYIYFLSLDFVLFVFFFFFQAEDGIRDGTVTGVQTCALPIFGINATAPSIGVTCPSSTTYTWAVAVSQQADGGTGNDFALVFSSATVTVGSCFTPTNLVLNSVSPSGVETALDQQITFTATLTNALTNAPISGETVAFRLGGEVQCSSATNGAGVATCSFQYTHGSLPAGSYGVQATFAGDPIPNLTAANSNSINLTVSATGTSVVPSPAQGPYNGTVTLSATLTAIGAGVQG